MFVLGLVLVAISAGALLAVIASGTDDRAALWGANVEVPTLVVFLAGAATLLVFIMGLELVRSGLKRASQNRRNNRRLRKLEKREAARQEAAHPPAPPAPAGAPPVDATGQPAPPPAEAPVEPAGGASTAPPAQPPSTGPYQSPPPVR